MALRLASNRPGPSASSQTTEIPVVAPLQSRLGVVQLRLEQTAVNPENLEAEPTGEIVETEQSQHLDDDSKYNIEFNLNGFPNVPNNIERQYLIKRLRERLQQKSTDARMTAFLIGRSGFGKTQLATHYAQLSKDKVYSSTFFIDGTTQSTLDRSLASILDQLWDHWPDLNMAGTETKPTDRESVRGLVHQWLSRPENKSWLIIMDSVADLDLVLPYLPPKEVGHGTVIITTQLLDRFSDKDFLKANFPGYTETIIIGGLDVNEGMELVKRVAGSLYGLTETDARFILKALEYNPQNITQFAKSLSHSKTIKNEYQRIVAMTTAGDNLEKTEDQMFEIACSSLFKTLEFGFGTPDGKDRQTRKDASKLLRLFSCFYHKDIWYGLVKSGRADPGPSNAKSGEDEHWLRRSTENPEAFGKRLQLLIEFGFIAVDSNSHISLMTSNEIEATRITIHERMLDFLRQDQYYDKNVLLFAASCVAYSNCSSFHSHAYEIRRRLMAHVESVRELLSRKEEYKVRAFYFEGLSELEQNVALRVFRDPTVLADEYIGFCNPLTVIASLLNWSNQTSDGLKLLENALKSFGSSLQPWDPPSMAYLKSSIAWLLAVGNDPKAYFPSLKYTHEAMSVFKDSETTVREFHQCEWLVIYLRTKWGQDEEKAAALKDNEEYLSTLRNKFPGTVYLLRSIRDSAEILLLHGKYEQSSERFVECFQGLKAQLSLSNPIFVNLAAKSAIRSEADRNKMYGHTYNIDDGVGSSRRSFNAMKAWEGFKNCLGEYHVRTVTQAQRLAWLYKKDSDIDGEIRVRKSIVIALGNITPPNPIDRATEQKLLAEALIRKNSSVHGGDATLLQEVKLSLEEGLRLIERTGTEQDMKIIALQFGFARLLCRIWEYTMAVPILRRVLSALKSFPKPHQYNVDLALRQLCEVYYMLSMRSDLDNVINAQWEVPKLPSENPTETIKTWENKIHTCMAYGYPQTALPLLEKIIAHLNMLPTTPGQEIQDLRLDFAECLASVNETKKAESIYQTILNGVSGQSNLVDQDRLRNCRALRGLAGIQLNDRNGLSLSLSTFQKAQYELNACIDQGQKKLRQYRAACSFSMAQIEFELFPTNAEVGALRRSERLFEEVLSIQDDNGRWLASNYFIGRTFYYLGSIDNINDRVSSAEERLRNSLKYLYDYFPSKLIAIDTSQHLLLLLLCRGYLKDRDKRNLSEIFHHIDYFLKWFTPDFMYNFETLSIQDIMPLDWKLSALTPIYTVDFLLTVMSEVGMILATFTDELQPAHRGYLNILRNCEELFGAEDWRSRNALYLLENIETIQATGVHDSKICLSPTGYFSWKEGDLLRKIWSNPGVRPPSVSSAMHYLSDDTSKILLRCGKWELVASKLSLAIKDRVIYNPPPNGSDWPQSWTYVPRNDKMSKDVLDIPLRIADIPVVIPAPKRYPSVYSSIPPEDPHAPINAADPLDPSIIYDIFSEFPFAQGFFLLLNQRLQIIVNEDFDYSSALAKKPLAFGGLQVEYVRNRMVHTTGHGPPHMGLQGLRINSKVFAKKSAFPFLKFISGESFEPARIGVRVCNKADPAKQFVTIPTHTFTGPPDFKEPTKHSSIFSLNHRMTRTRNLGQGVAVYEESTLKPIGLIDKVFDYDRPSAVANIRGPDVSLITPRRTDLISQVVSPIPNLRWITATEWNRLKTRLHADLKILGAQEIVAAGISSRGADCEAIGEGVFLAEQGMRVDKNDPGESDALRTIMERINRCLLVRVQNWGPLEPPGSGIGVYAESEMPGDCALVGFISWKQIPRDEIEAQRQHLYNDSDMDDTHFVKSIQNGNVAFFGVWQIPQALSNNYDIVSVTVPPVAGHQ